MSLLVPRLQQVMKLEELRLTEGNNNNILQNMISLTAVML